MNAQIPGPAVHQTVYIDKYSTYYGKLDGYSFCGYTYEYEFSSESESSSRLLSSVLTDTAKPIWMDISRNKFVIGANTAFDRADSITVTVKVLGKEQILAQEPFTASLECDNALCEPSDYDAEPIFEDCFEGEIGENPEEDIWFVPKRFYQLSKVEMWLDERISSGFKVTYSLPESDDFDESWPEEISHMFGYDYVPTTQEVALTTDLESMRFCIDTWQKVAIYRDVEGLQFKPLG